MISSMDKVWHAPKNFRRRGHAGQALTALALISKEETHRDEEILCGQASDVERPQLL
jgi:hypothetical protein